MHPVGELDHHDGPLTRCSDEPSCYGSRALPELAQDYVHSINLAVRGFMSTERLPRAALPGGGPLDNGITRDFAVNGASAW